MHDDFDTQRQPLLDAKPSTFTIGGATMSYRPQVAADLIADYYDAMGSDDPGGRNARVVATADALVESVLVDEKNRELWRKVRSVDATLPLNIREVQMVADRVLEVMLDRPTERSSASGTSPEPSGTTSTDDSGSQADGG